MAVLGILGAGPKALAIAAKARVLKDHGFVVPDIVIFEKERVGLFCAASEQRLGVTLDYVVTDLIRGQVGAETLSTA